MNNVKKSIGWADFTINPVKGLCPMACPYCYARRMYKRFKWNPEIRYDDSAFDGIDKIDRKQGQRVFVGSTIELFGDWIPEGWMKTIFEYCHLYYHTTFIFLTKRPTRLSQFNPYPDNCYIGVSVTNQSQFDEAVKYLKTIDAKVKFLSIEPLFGYISMKSHSLVGIGQVIIGQVTPIKKATMPKREWVEEIEDACRKADIPYFEKNNLKDLLGRDLIQQFPKGVALVH